MKKKKVGLEKHVINLELAGDIMKKETKKQLKQKGWVNKDIERAEKIIENRKTNDKSNTTEYTNKVIYWTVILVILIGNFVVSMLLVPFLMVFDKLVLDLFVITLGLGFGGLFTVLVKSVEHIEKKHHILAGLIVPITAIINIFAVVWMANTLNDYLRITELRANPYIIGMIYVVAFIAPYIISLLRENKD